MSFLEFVRDFAIAGALLLAFLWMIGCAYIEKNIYVLESDNITVEYTTLSSTETDAKDLLKITGKLK